MIGNLGYLVFKEIYLLHNFLEHCLKELVAIGQYRQVVKMDGFWENGLVVTSDQAGWWPDA